ENGWSVIDTGLHNKQRASRWEKELAGKEVTDIFIAHYHPDDVGYAGRMQETTGAKHSMSKIDEQAAFMAWENDFLNSLADNYSIATIPEDIAQQMIENTKEFIPRVTPYPTVQHHFTEGEKVVMGRYEYEVIF